ncbi:MAG: hypothetical protein NT130_02825 [Candidatus Micrarchaeota archaeon]|nr:hypothetical protein [Candidatus Micrarchaeota archaeon]
MKREIQSKIVAIEPTRKISLKMSLAVIIFLLIPSVIFPFILLYKDQYPVLIIPYAILQTFLVLALTYISIMVIRSFIFLKFKSITGRFIAVLISFLMYFVLGEVLAIGIQTNYSVDMSGDKIFYIISLPLSLLLLYRLSLYKSSKSVIKRFSKEKNVKKIQSISDLNIKGIGNILESSVHDSIFISLIAIYFLGTNVYNSQLPPILTTIVTGSMSATFVGIELLAVLFLGLND